MAVKKVTEKKEKVSSEPTKVETTTPSNQTNSVTLALIFLALVILGGIIYYAWSIKPSDNSANTGNTTTETTDKSAAEVDKLGPKEVKLTPENFDEIISKNKLVLVDVYSPTCPHCQTVAPILTELSNEYGDKLVVAKMTTAEEANITFITSKFSSFQYVPAFWLYKDGKNVWSETGAKTKDEFKVLIDKYLK